MNLKQMAVITVFGALLLTAPSAKADVNCTTTYNTFQTFTTNVVVPAGATCIFNAGASVTGNVTVNGSLAMFSGTVTGNVQSNSGCGIVGLISVTVNGNFQVHNCTGGAVVQWSTIGNDFQCQNNPVLQYSCFLYYSQVKGNATVQNNVAPSSTNAFGAVIAGNTIAKNLMCSGNTPAPTNTGVKNAVTGNPNNSNEGQCQNF